MIQQTVKKKDLLHAKMQTKQGLHIVWKKQEGSLFKAQTAENKKHP